MNRALVIGILAVTAGACTAPRTERLGLVDVGPPPPPLQQAVLAEVDGQRVKAGRSRTRFFLNAGAHSLAVVDAASASFSDEERAALPRFSIDIEAGRHYFLALAQKGDHGTTPVIWQVKSLEPGTLPSR